MAKIIGLTGGIASGKTTVANYLVTKGIPVYFSDDQAKRILNLKSTIKKLILIFGKDILNPDEKIDKLKLAEIVFNNNEQLTKLNAIIHPLVNKHFKNWVNKNSFHKFLIKESALLFETKAHINCYITILITAPLEVRIERAIKRDNLSRAHILRRIEKQMPEQEKEKLATYTIHNLDITETFKKIDDILKILNNS